MIVFTFLSLVRFYFNEFVLIAKKIKCLFYYILLFCPIVTKSPFKQSLLHPLPTQPLFSALGTDNVALCHRESYYY